MENHKVSVAKLNEILKPFEISFPHFGKDLISKFEIERALFKIDLLGPDKRIRSRKDHIRRIAWYVAYGFGSPIKLKINQSSQLMIEEGRHKLCAAIIRGDKEVGVNIAIPESFFGAPITSTLVN